MRARSANRLNSRPARQNGVTLVELMVSVTISLFLLAGLSYLLVNNSGARQEIEKSGRQIENGRYAIELLSEDIRHAGFFGQLSTLPSVPGTIANCSVAVADLQAGIALPITGIDNATAAPACVQTAQVGSFAPNTDVVVIRRAGTETPILPTSPVVVANQHYVQSTPGLYRLDVGSQTTSFVLTNDDGTPARLRKYVQRIFFVDRVGGIPVLRRGELVDGAFTTVSLVEGIENLQLQYGIDADNDGAPDSYSDAPATPADWARVVTARLYVLARNNDPSGDHTDTKTYDLGTTSVGPFNDRFKRHVYAAVVRLNNPSQRKEAP